MPASIILLTGAVKVPMPNAWIATKSHFCEAMLSIAERCLTASSWPSNQVTSTLNSLPQYSAACLPWAHQVACRPALENAAFSGFADMPASLAIAADISGLKPMPPSTAAAPPPSAALRNTSRRCLSNFVPIVRLSHASRFTVGVRDHVAGAVRDGNTGASEAAICDWAGSRFTSPRAIGIEAGEGRPGPRGNRDSFAVFGLIKRLRHGEF